jgi:peptidoglycan LD-endopeptidase CwlK
MAADLYDVDKRDADFANLHPSVRAAISKVIADLQSSNIPLFFFEGYRSPRRQHYLYQQGRAADGSIIDRKKIVTYTDSWRSYHQYGLAADFVFKINGKWVWEEPSPGLWDRFHAIGTRYGLAPLNFEKPHLQYIGTSSSALIQGRYPEGGDQSWVANLTAAIADWDGDPAAPPPPSSGGAPSDERRPPIA